MNHAQISGSSWEVVSAAELPLETQSRPKTFESAAIYHGSLQRESIRGRAPQKNGTDISAFPRDPVLRVAR
jgi:hypothetical protein